MSAVGITEEDEQGSFAEEEQEVLMEVEIRGKL